MFMDVQTRLWNATALSANAVSTNSYTVGTADNAVIDIGNGEPLAVMMAILVAAKSSGGTETYQFDLISTTDAALTANLEVLTSWAFTAADVAAGALAAGRVYGLPLPVMRMRWQTYLGLRFVGANTPTITVTADIMPLSFVQASREYATRIVVL